MISYALEIIQSVKPESFFRDAFFKNLLPVIPDQWPLKLYFLAFFKGAMIWRSIASPLLLSDVTFKDKWTDSEIVRV